MSEMFEGPAATSFRLEAPRGSSQSLNAHEVLKVSLSSPSPASGSVLRAFSGQIWRCRVMSRGAQRVISNVDTFTREYAISRARLMGMYQILRSVSRHHPETAYDVSTFSLAGLAGTRLELDLSFPITIFPHTKSMSEVQISIALYILRRGFTTTYFLDLVHVWFVVSSRIAASSKDRKLSQYQ